MGGQRARRRSTAWVAVGLAALAVAVTVVVWRKWDDTLSTGVTGGIALAVTVAGGWVAWAAYQKPPDLDLAVIADQIADAVFKQWDGELRRRQIGDPHPLPVAWDPANTTLTEDWSSIRQQATSGAWPPEPAGAPWATSPAQLAGRDKEIIDVLDRIPTGRLVILGEPGAGKTILAVRLLLALLARRAQGGQGGPVPVLLSLASWNPTDQDLTSWLETSLIRNHSGLDAPAPDATGQNRNRAQALLDRRLLLPILDGLDELPPALRATALAKISEMLPDGQGLVLTCRKQAFRWAIRPSYWGGVESKLKGAAAVVLRTLTPDEVADYFQKAPGGPVVTARWDEVVASFTATSPPPVTRVLTTPLMASLAHTIYNPRRGESLQGVPNPVDLLNPTRFPTATSVREHLLDEFIPAAYRPHPHRKVQQWLQFLARHLEDRLHGTPDLAWWQLRTAAPWRFLDLIARLTFGLAFGLGIACAARFMLGPGIGPGLGAMAGLVAGDRFARVCGLRMEPSRGVRWQPSLVGFRIGRMGGLVYGLAYGFTAGIVYGIAAGLAYGLTVGFTFGLTGAVAELRTAASPKTVLKRDRRAFRILGFTQGLSGAVTYGLGGGFMVVFVSKLTDGGLTDGGLTVVLVLILAGWFTGMLTGGLSQAAWGWFALARLWLAASGQVPWRFMGFLADAHERGVLRQVGAVYQFRHVELQRRLAR
ncbi:NACHT domain-containing protein [Candidatus Protofrankia californiensis]|uniref:NACHT domain-containing protein n=1 Tax=Candidatus Protofrankia californiensis TaxID=1839754 RepID=UPI001F49CB6D|nr:NACHT domain-containing protein [Candidatus Protofrankia californiensis]